MTRSTDHRSPSQYPADEVYAVMVDPEFLRARLERMGGPGAALLEHTADDAGARYRVRHGLDGSELPSIVRAMLTGEIVIERTESWTRTAPGRYSGDAAVTIHGAPVPVSATGTMRLADRDGGSDLDVRTAVTVKVPLIGGQIESAVADQVRKLLAAEAGFTLRWLASRH